MPDFVTRILPVLIVMVVLIAFAAIYFWRKYKEYQQGGWEVVIDSIRPKRLQA